LILARGGFVGSVFSADLRSCGARYFVRLESLSSGELVAHVWSFIRMVRKVQRERVLSSFGSTSVRPETNCVSAGRVEQRSAKETAPYAF